MKRTWTRRGFARLAATASLSAAGAGLFPPAVVGAAKAKVVVVGGGAGGATVARRLAAATADLEVTLVNDSPRHSTCYFSNLAIAGLRSFDSISHDYETLKRAGVKLLIDRAIAIDPVARRVDVAGGGRLTYDRLVVAPGIDFDHRQIEGYGEEAAETMPHAWRGGTQALALRQRLLHMEDGGTVIICPPAEPYRCPPGPYERASLVAQYLKQHKPRSKLVILDAKNKFAKQALFEEAWARFYPGMIEWLPEEFTGGVTAVDAANMTVSTADETFQASVANVIPPQTCGKIAIDAGLADDSGWCPVEPATLASRLQDDVHLVGDAIDAGDMPKAATSANSQAEVCTEAILADLLGAKPGEPRFDNVCWSFLAAGHAVKVGANYAATPEKIAKTDSYISQLDESDAVRADTAQRASGWYAAFTGDIFG